MLWGLAGMLWSICVLTFVPGTVALVRSLRVRRGVPARGVVVAYEDDDDGVVPVCGYVVDGNAFRVSASVVYARSRFPLGSTMAVRYLADDPGTARVTQGSNLYATAIGLYLTAIVFGALAAGLTYALL